MKFNSTYSKLTESFLIDKPEYLLQRYLNLTPDKYLKIVTENGKEFFNTIVGVFITSYLVKNGKLLVNFNSISGSFICTKLGLTTLEGCPKIVYGDFIVHSNNLTSLDYLPIKVTGDFVCYGNFKNFSQKEVFDKCNVKGHINNV